jgi:hypothetical protein
MKPPKRKFWNVIFLLFCLSFNFLGLTDKSSLTVFGLFSHGGRQGIENNGKEVY